MTEAQVGQDTHLYSEFYQPLHAPGVWFSSFYGSVGQTTRGVFQGDNKVADYLVGSARAGVDVGATLGTAGNVRLGARWTQVNARVETGDPVLPAVRELTSGFRLAFVLDQIDHAWFAQSGVRAGASYYGATTALGSALDYQKLAADATYVHSWGSNTLNVHAEGGTDFDSGMPAYESFTLGGPLRLSAFRMNQFAGHEFAFARAMFYRRVFALPDLLGTGVYVGASAEIGRIRDRYQQQLQQLQGTLYSASVFLGADTFAGPAYIGAGVGNGGAVSAFLLLGAP